MAAPTLLLSGAVHLVAACAFLVAARRLRHRLPQSRSRGPARAFLLWWAALGAYMALQGTMTVLAGADRLDAGAYFATRFLAVPLLAAAVWGLTFHVAFLFTGRRAWGARLGAFYLAAGALFAYVTATGPREVRVERWIVEMAPPDGPLLGVVYVAIGLPPILASAAYLGLLPRVRSPRQRYRIVLVAGSILLWVATGLAARLAGSDLAAFLTLVPAGLAASGLVVAAYSPPAFVRRRWEEPEAYAPAAARHGTGDDQRAALERRIRELV